MSENNGAYDLIVIGAGPGGYVAAARAAQLGLATVLVEEQTRRGGTCLLRGCIPTKALIHAAEVYETCRKGARVYGVSVGEVDFDWSKVMRRKDTAILKGSKGVDLLLEHAGVTVITGRGRLDGPGRVVVAESGGAEGAGGTRVLTAPRIVLATGSVPTQVPGITVDGQRILTSDHLLEIETVPQSMIVLGAGAVGVELAQVMPTFACKVSLVEMLDRIIPLEDPDCAAELEQALKRQGMKVLTAHRALGVEARDDGVRCTLLDIAAGEEKELHAECLLVAVGRRAATRDIGLDSVEVVTDRAGCIQTDSNMETATPGLYAIGDIVPTQQLAHLASREALVAVGHAAGKPLPPIRYHLVPSCIYTRPEVASVGLSGEEARAQGYEIREGRFTLASLAKASILNEPHGFVKVVADAENNRPLGVHLVGARVTELVAAATTALGLGADLDQWREIIHPHPTLSEAVLEAVHAAAGEALHGG